MCIEDSVYLGSESLDQRISSGQRGYILPSKELISAGLRACGAGRPSGANIERSPNPGAEPLLKEMQTVAAPALADTCLPSGSSAWAFPTESEINKAVNNPLPVRLKDRRALDRDRGRCRATRGPANFVPPSGTETAERWIPDRKEQLNLQGLTGRGTPNPPPPEAGKNGGRSLSRPPAPALSYCGSARGLLIYS